MDRVAPAPPPDDAEAALLAELRAGQSGAFEALVRQHGGRMLAVVRRLLANEDDASEALQDAFLSAFRSLQHFDGRSLLSTWLHRIAVNAALQKLRSRSRKPSRSLDDLLPTFLSDGHQANPAAAWHEMSNRDLERRETCQVVRRAIDELPESYRTVLVLRDIEGMDTEQAAARLGVTVGVIKTRLHRARQALQALLDPHFQRGTL